MEFADRAAALARQIGVAERLSEARTVAGTAYCDLGRFEPAKEAFDEAIGSIENLRSQVAGNEQEDLRYFETKLSPYHGMVDLLINQKDINQALAYAERAKAGALLDLLTLGKVRITGAMSDEERKQEHSLNREICLSTVRPIVKTTRLTPRNFFFSSQKHS